METNGNSSAEDIVQYTGSTYANPEYCDGRLRPIMGAQHIQVLRANRAHPEWAGGFDWTYNHAPMLAHWNGRFYLEYLSSPVSEGEIPGRTLLMRSEDGVRWTEPEVAFPIYRFANEIVLPDGTVHPQGSSLIMHQRMGFYLAPNGMMLLLGFYGSNNGKGIGRAVREIRRDDSLGPIYFVRFNRHYGWNEANAQFPFYAESGDARFREACESLLRDKLVTLQWWEEDRSPDGFYAIEGGKALSSYKLPDGRIVGLWKDSKAAISDDGGISWSPMSSVPTLVMTAGKIWGQRTSDGKYALLYNPTHHRWPLAAVTGEDGIHFDHLTLVNGEMSPRRYYGRHKDYGPSYTRGIEAGAAPDSALWAAYSMNKEDLWVSRIPVPIRFREDRPVADDFDRMDKDAWIPSWNIHSYQWATVKLAEDRVSGGQCLEFRDREPSDCARAERKFPESRKVAVSFTAMAGQEGGTFHIDVSAAKGTVAARMLFDTDGYFKYFYKGTYRNVFKYEPGKWHEIMIEADASRQRFQLTAEGVRRTVLFIAPVPAVERIIFRTGEERVRADLSINAKAFSEDLTDVDQPVAEKVFRLKRVATSGHDLKETEL